MTCKSLIQFKASIWCSSEPIVPKTSWKHGPLQNYEHACTISWRTTSKLQIKGMHAWARLQFDIWTNSRLKSLRIQELGMHKLKHNNERLNSLPRASITRWGSLICNLCSNSFNYQAIYKNISTLPFSLSLWPVVLSKWAEEKIWFKCTRLKCVYLHGPLTMAIP